MFSRSCDLCPTHQWVGPEAVCQHHPLAICPNSSSSLATSPTPSCWKDYFPLERPRGMCIQAGMQMCMCVCPTRPLVDGGLDAIVATVLLTSCPWYSLTGTFLYACSGQNTRQNEEGQAREVTRQVHRRRPSMGQVMSLNLWRVEWSVPPVGIPR